MEVGFKVEEVINRLNDKATSSQELEQEWHDVARKLQAWTAALGIVNGQSSSSRKFTRRLDMSSHLLKAVETLLSGILELLSDIPGTDVVLDEAEIETGTLNRASSGSDDSDEDVDILLEQSSLDLAHECVNDLNNMVPALINPAPHNAITNSRYARITLMQEIDVKHLEEKYPNAPLLLRQRLGRLNWQRRILRECARMHQDPNGDDNINDSRVEQAASEAPTGPRSGPAASVVPPSVLPMDSVAQPQTNISTQPSTLPTSSHSVFDAPVRDNDSLSSAGTMSSYAATVHPRDDKHIPVPPPPAGCLEGLPFDCDICYRRVTNVKGSRRWKRHVFQDLRPYVCTYEGCRNQDAMFASRREWFEHEMNIHCINYLCIPPCQEAFDTYFEFHRHLKQGHNESLSDEQIRLMADMRKASAFPQNGIPCPLCQTHCSSSKQLEKHLGGDLEQIALFTLPLMEGSGNIDDDDDSDGNYDDSSEGVSLASSNEMDVEEKMELLSKNEHYGGPDNAPDSGSEIQPEHVTLGIPYCRRNGQPEFDWLLRSFDEERPFSCTSSCGQHFSTKAKWKAHEELNFPRAWWICKLCSDIFPRRDRLQDHKKKQHGQTKVEPTEKHNANQRAQFSRPCFFSCGYSGKDFDQWVNHVGRHFAVDVRKRYPPTESRLLDAGPLDVLSVPENAAKGYLRSNSASVGLAPPLPQNPSHVATPKSQADKVYSKVEDKPEALRTLQSREGRPQSSAKGLPTQLGPFNPEHSRSIIAGEQTDTDEAARSRPEAWQNSPPSPLIGLTPEMDRLGSSTSRVQPSGDVPYAPSASPVPMPMPRYAQPLNAVSTSTAFATGSYALASIVITQIEYYFSIKNLTKDLYLRKLMDSEGWVPLYAIASFRRMNILLTDEQYINEPLETLNNIVFTISNNVFERQFRPDGWYIRKAYGWEPWVLSEGERHSQDYMEKLKADTASGLTRAYLTRRQRNRLGRNTRYTDMIPVWR
jgi:La domain